MGAKYAFHERMLEVVSVSDTIVTYMDNYVDGYSAERRCSRIQWELDVERGLMIPIEEEK
jgi:hypothetical protein